MYTVSKVFHFCAAHRLQEHKGKCRFIHGHNYRVVVTLQAPGLSSQGMVLDFSSMKAIVGEYFNNEYDHRLILEANDPILIALARTLDTEQFNNIKTMIGPPTAENMSRVFFQELDAYLADLVGHSQGIEVSHVQVEETEGSEASYES